MNPMVDGWMGDDWFHNGAFRQQNMPYIYEQIGTRDNDPKAKWWTAHFDDYDEYMSAGSAGELGRRHGLEQIGFWRKLIAHPAYDAFWSDQAMDKVLAAEFSANGIQVPILLVHSLWDQEDIYGAPAVYKAIKPLDKNNDKVFMVLGPWHHGQEIEPADSLGAIRFGSDTGTWFRKNVLGTIPRPLPQGRCSGNGRRARDRLRNRAKTNGRSSRSGPLRPLRSRSILQAGFKLSFDRHSSAQFRARASTSTSPIQPSPFPSAPDPASPSATICRSPGRSGSSTISAKPRAAPTC